MAHTPLFRLMQKLIRQAMLEQGIDPSRRRFIKLVLAKAAGIADPLELIDRQRGAYLQALRSLDDVAAQANGDDTAALLVEGAALHLEADLKWLDLCERRLTDGS